MKDRPLLMANTAPYIGAWVPIEGPSRTIVALGLGKGDLVQVQVRDRKEKLEDTYIDLHEDAEVEINSPDGAMVRATRLLSTGREVFVWVS